MSLAIANFAADFQTSINRYGASVYNIGTDEPLYAAFVYAEHTLFKIVAVGDSLNEAHDVADVIASQFTKRYPRAWIDWVCREFPNEVHRMSREQIAQLFA